MRSSGGAGRNNVDTSREPGPRNYCKCGSSRRSGSHPLFPAPRDDLNPFQLYTRFHGGAEQLLGEPSRVDRAGDTDPEPASVEEQVGGGEEIAEFGAVALVQSGDQGGPEGISRAAKPMD